MIARSLLVVCALAAAALPARASRFWDRVDSPAESAAPNELHDLVERGAELGTLAARFRQQAADNRQINGSLATYRMLRAEMKHNGERAIELLERALKLAPDDAGLHLALAEFYYEFLYTYYEDDLPMPAKHVEAGLAAIAHWDRFEELAPYDPRRLNFFRNAYPTSPISGATNLVRFPYQFRRSIVHTKIGGDEHWQASIDDYEYCLIVAPAELAPADWTAQLLTNSAEILMALGRLDEAIERYEQALQYQNDVLYLYGLAVAYDRKGLVARAADTLLDALQREQNAPMSALDREGVFFVPDGDIHYYKALAYEAQGDAKLALLHYREFLRRAKDTRYAEQANRHIEALTRGKTGHRR